MHNYFFFVIIVAPSITSLTDNSTVVIAEGNMETITCEAIGYPPATLEWSRSDGALSDRVSVSDTFLSGFGVGLNLTITNASREDAGVYTCSANNSIGSDNESISVTVQCKCM